MAVSVGVLTAKLTLDSSGFKKGVTGAKADAKAFGDQMDKIGTRLSVGVTLPLTLLGKKILEIGMSYEKAMHVFQATTQATEAEMAKAAATAVRLGADMSLPATSAADAATAMTELAKGGLSAAQAMEAARGVLQLAAAATISEGEAATITANALNAFGLAATESGRVADLLAAAANASSAEITQIAQSMQQSAASAAALKIPIEDLVTSIGLMANAGIKGSDAGTSLKTMMNALTPKTEAAATAMEALGIDAFDAAGRFIGLKAIIEQATPALARMTDEQRQMAIETAFGSDAQRAANVILGSGVEKWTAMGEAVGRTGAAQELAGAKAKGLGGAIEGLKSQLETAALTLYQQVAPGLEVVTRKIADMAGGLTTLSPQVITAGAAFAATFAVAGPAALAVGQFVKILTVLTPTGWVIVAMIAASAALAAAYASDFGGMQKTINAFFADYSSGAKESAKSSESIGTGMKVAAELFNAGLDAILTGIRELLVVIRGAATIIYQALTGDWSGIKATWAEGTAALSKIDEAWRKRLEASGTAIEKIYGDAGRKATTAFEGAFKNANPNSFLIKQMQANQAELNEQARKTGFSLMTSLKAGSFAASHQSPFFLTHWFQQSYREIQGIGWEGLGAAIGRMMGQGVGRFLEPVTETVQSFFQDVKVRFEQAMKDLEVIADKSVKVWGVAGTKVKDAMAGMTKAAKEGSEDQERVLRETRDMYDDAFSGLLGGWGDFANQTLGILNGMNKDIPSSLGGLLESITGLFTDSAEEAQEWAKKISATISGVTTFLNSRHQGKVKGVLGGAQAGMQIGGAFGGGIGAAIGAGVGALVGLFGTGKSAEQKAAEEREKKKMAMDMEKAAIDIQGAAMDVMKKALETFKHLADHVDVPKAAIQSFFKTLEKTTKLFLQLAAKFAKENLEGAKLFAESMMPVVELIGGAVQVFDSLRFFTSIPERAIKDMAADLGKAAEAMGEMAIAVEDHIEKKAKRFAERVMPVIELIGSAFEAFTALADFKGVAAQVFTDFFADVETAVNLMGELADNLSRNFLNKAKTYSERIGAIVQTIGTSVAALTSLRTYEAVPQAAFAALEHDIMTALTMIDRLVIAGEQYMDRAITFQHLMEAVAGAIGSGVSALRSIGGSALSGGPSLDAIRMAPTPGAAGSSGGGGTTVIIDGLAYTGTDPRTQRVVDSVQALLGQGGMPITARAY